MGEIGETHLRDKPHGRITHLRINLTGE